MIIQCIPNFSEGHRADIIEGLADAAGSAAGCALLDYSADASHNRSVFTLLGSSEGVKAAAIAMARYAIEHIDMRQHKGEHPRMGAVDVIPFVPIKGVSMKECVEISRQVGAAIGEMGLPVFLYEESAAKEARRNLADVRKGQFEGLAAKMAKPQWAPDFGPAEPHPSAGAVAVGARMPLIAFNANLSTPDVDVANAIAKVIRGSGGGLKYCKAIGILLEEENTAQVSMNLVNYEVTPIYRVVELIRAEARRYGVHITKTELVGLAPARALIDCAQYYLQLNDLEYGRQVLENHIL